MTRLTSAASLRLAAIHQHLASRSPASSSSSNSATTKQHPTPHTPLVTRKNAAGDRHSFSSSKSDSSHVPQCPSPPEKDTPQLWTRPDTYRYWLSVQSRWSDNDVYGHMNNAKYYELFDTIVNKYMREECEEEEEVKSMGLVVHSECDYLKPMAGFPGRVVLGLATERVGRSSVAWRIGVWAAATQSQQIHNRDDLSGCHAFAQFVHVFVDHASRTKVHISPAVRAGAERLLVQ
ncbi:hypothetical protein PCASD_07750 [Puccinia coronata f. sp. avenae]|uniref:Thioesterase domain-containing protein n=1 Tax=Puccinia coronata f. sp. avenae TaxID=200324 RepID=A0A2N5TBM6_9BASI|nr:hypothetical protein PCASD_16224 [Puccinia coronata f. sp. avenae]PLW42283.1 hypothetical protein PCASD_07750 [Puccinia coronata f. sp. avenae]